MTDALVVDKFGGSSVSDEPLGASAIPRPAPHAPIH